MTAYLKRDAPHAEREAISRIEATADQSIDGLPLSAFPRNVATWALLTSVTRRIELVRTERDEATQDFKSAMLNYARIATMVCGWLAERCPETSEIRLKWTDELDVASEATLATCIRYAAFWNGFPAWHGNIFAAELLDSYAVRFWSSPAEFDRRVSAYQKGIRPGGTVAEADRPSDDARNEGIVQMLERILGRAEKYGKIGVRYDLSRESIAVMTDYYDDRLLAQFRRADDIRIGVYTIRQFRRIYAVLRALCNAHQYVCDGWSHTRSATYPLDSAVLVRSRSNWISFFQKHAKLGPKPEESKQVVDAVLLDLTLADRPVDLHVHPFVALDREANSLALIPHFPLNSRPDENALRICSYRNPTAFSRAVSFPI